MALWQKIFGMKIVQLFNGQSEKKKEFSELNNGYFKATLFRYG